MVHVINMRHPLSPNMMKSTFLCRQCNRTRTYVLAASGLEASSPNGQPQAA